MYGTTDSFSRNARNANLPVYTNSLEESGERDMQKTEAVQIETKRPRMMWYVVAVALTAAVIAGGYERTRLQPNPSWVTISAPNPPRVAIP
jgi:hypothetical protein